MLLKLTKLSQRKIANITLLINLMFLIYFLLLFRNLIESYIINYIFWIPFYNSLFQLIYFKRKIRFSNVILIILVSIILLFNILVASIAAVDGPIKTIKMIINPFYFLINK